MAITTAYTLSEAKEMLTLWKGCEKTLADGQAKVDCYKKSRQEK